MKRLHMSKFRERIFYGFKQEHWGFDSRKRVWNRRISKSKLFWPHGLKFLMESMR